MVVAVVSLSGSGMLWKEKATPSAVVACVFVEEEEKGSTKERWKPPLLTCEHDNGGGLQLHMAIMAVASMAEVAFNDDMLKVN